ncbi:zinc finger CCCH domain-containing protein 18-like [Ylistrum balloti]|uniref:zinc finger CCCH domain-containing protein 18-like n=1 Tax=Ylistrum balloti TaxID=509963 RepID=UPI002905D418|nr:zinc finger CCCH domain-containing protein 18-like [Ylistrum balloti]
MATLVADYGDSDENSDIEFEVTDDDRLLSSPSKATVETVSTEPRKTVNFFQSVDSDSSSSDEEDNKTKKENASKGDNQNKLPNPLAEKLPTPSLRDLKDSQSVFSNKYELAEKAKNSILEQHVKMTEARKQAKKNVCFKFQKGKCKFGKNCKFSHDCGSDIVVNSTKQDEEKSQNEADFNSGFGGAGRSVHCDPNVRYGDTLPPVDAADDDSYMARTKRKKHAGLSENLVPSKRAMSSLDRQRIHERPWTVNNKKKNY